MSRCRHEHGFVLMTAMIVLLVMLLLGLAVMSTVTGQVTETGQEKAGEAAFNFAESVLDAEVYQLQTKWPTLASSALPICTNQSLPTGCESVAALGPSLQSTYGPYYAGASWSVQVIDDPTGSSPYTKTLAATMPSWDQYATGRMWILAQATLGGQKRELVEQVVHASSVLTVPDDVIAAGAVYTENDGNNTYIQAYDQNTGITGNLQVRCQNSQPTPVQGAGNCEGWDAGKGQLSPTNTTVYSDNYQDPGGDGQVYSNNEIAAFIATATANSTYYTSCPPGHVNGVVVLVNVNCSFGATDTWNSEGSPGMLVLLGNSTIEFTGNETFYGLIYNTNQNGSLPPCTKTQMQTPVVTVQGNAVVHGAVFADGCGTVAVGESKTNVVFDSNAIHNLQVLDSAMPAQNTFRIIPNS